MPKKDPREQFDLEEVSNEAKILNKLLLKSFTANPKTIRPFEASTLTWDVSVPAEAASHAGLRFSLGGRNPVDRAGSKLVSPLQTGAFILEAHVGSASRLLGHVIVTVDAVACQQIELRSLQLRPQAEALRDRFLAGSLSARGDVSVASGDDGLVVTIPLKIALPNFFDADVDVELKIGLSARAGRAVVALVSVDVDIIFHIAEHILSLGTATAAQSLLQPLAADLIKAFLGAQLEGDLSQDVNALIGQLLELWEGADPKKRKFKLYAITTTSVGLTITGCPV